MSGEEQVGKEGCSDKRKTTCKGQRTRGSAVCSDLVQVGGLGRVRGMRAEAGGGACGGPSALG